MHASALRERVLELHYPRRDVEVEHDPELTALLDYLTRAETDAALGRGFGGVPPWSGYPSDPSPFFAAGGGPLADMGVYPLHAITGILGPARRVSAFASHVQEDFVVQDGALTGQRIPIEVEDNWMLLL